MACSWYLTQIFSKTIQNALYNNLKLSAFSVLALSKLKSFLVKGFAQTRAFCLHAICLYIFIVDANIKFPQQLFN